MSNPRVTCPKCQAPESVVMDGPTMPGADVAPAYCDECGALKFTAEEVPVMVREWNAAYDGPGDAYFQNNGGDTDTERQRNIDAGRIA